MWLGVKERLGLGDVVGLGLGWRVDRIKLTGNSEVRGEGRESRVEVRRQGRVGVDGSGGVRVREESEEVKNRVVVGG